VPGAGDRAVNRETWRLCLMNVLSIREFKEMVTWLLANDRDMSHEGELQ
jgi:hypothetical protein